MLISCKYIGSLKKITFKSDIFLRLVIYLLDRSVVCFALLQNNSIKLQPLIFGIHMMASETYYAQSQLILSYYKPVFSLNFIENPYLLPTNTDFSLTTWLCQHCISQSVSLPVSVIVIIISNEHVELLTRNLKIRQISKIIFYLQTILIHKLTKFVQAYLGICKSCKPLERLNFTQLS